MANRAFVRFTPQVIFDVLTGHSIKGDVRNVSVNQRGDLVFEVVGQDVPEGDCAATYTMHAPVIGGGRVTVFAGLKPLD